MKGTASSILSWVVMSRSSSAMRLPTSQSSLRSHEAHIPRHQIENMNLAPNNGSEVELTPDSTISTRYGNSFLVPDTVSVLGKVVPIGYRRRLHFVESTVLQIGAATFVLIYSRWGRILRGWRVGDSVLGNWLSLFIIAVLSRLLCIFLNFFYKEIFVSPALCEPQSVAPSLQSQFKNVSGIVVHLLVEEAPFPEMSTTILHCNHGFGASSLSWTPVLSRLSTLLNTKALAHDCPGFGLTERAGLDRIDDYSIRSNAKISIELLDELYQDKHVVFMGHSMGGVAAAMAAVSSQLNGKKITLILVSPALFSVQHRNLSKKIVSETNSDSIEELSDNPTVIERPPVRKNTFFGASVLPMFMRAYLFFFRKFFLPVASRLLGFLLHILVYRGNFWKFALQAAWFDKKRVDLDTVNRYRWPALVKNWDVGLAMFALSQRGWKSQVNPDSPDESLVDALARKANAGMRILVVHGQQDKIIGISLSRALKKCIPSIELVEIPNCGHVPHEECPDEFVETICSFLKK